MPCMTMATRPSLAQELNSPATLRMLGIIALFLGILILVLRPLAFPNEPYLWGGDYTTFWTGSWLAQHGELARLYGTKMLTHIPGLSVPAAPWFYPPTMLLAVYPAASLPFLLSYGIFCVIALTAAIAAWRIGKFSKLHLLLLLAAPAVLLNLLYGQNGVLTAAFWCIGLTLLPTHAFLAGALLGLTTVKPQLAILLPFLLLASRNLEAFTGFALTSFALIAGSFALFGMQPWLDFLTTLSGVSQLLESGKVIDVSKIGSLYIAARLAGAGFAEAMLLHAALALAAFVFCLHAWSRTDLSHGHKAAIALITALLLTPYQFVYDLALLLPAMAFWQTASAGKLDGTDRLTLWLLWIAPFISQAGIVAFGVGLLPAVLVLALWRLHAGSIMSARARLSL